MRKQRQGSRHFFLANFYLEVIIGTMDASQITFRALAAQTLARGASQATVEGWVREGLLTKTEMLALLEGEHGLALAATTIDYYVKIGLLPRPLVSWKRTGKGKESYYPPASVATILAAKKAQDEGKSLTYFMDNMVRTPGGLAIDISEGGASLDDFLIGKFTSLSVLLVDNIPDLSTMSLYSYLDVEVVDDFNSTILPEKLDQIKSYCHQGVSLLAKLVDQDYDRVITLEQEHKDLPTIFSCALRETFKANIAAIYYKISQDMPQKEKFKVANLERGQYRVEVVLAYIKAAEAAENVARQVFQARQSDARK